MYLFGKKNDSVGTPSYLYDTLDEEFKFDFDPCPLDPDPKEDGLKKDWGLSTFVNPPYSKIAPWLKKAVDWCREGEEERKVVFLIPYRGTTNYWRNYVFPYSEELRMLTKHVVFNGYKANFPLPMVVCVFTSNSCKEENKKKETTILTGKIIKKRTKAVVRYYRLK